LPVLGVAAVGALIAIDAASAEPRTETATAAPPISRTALLAGEASRTTYQAYLAADCLTGSNFCKFIAEPIPSRRRLEIQRVACQGWHASDTPPNFVTMAELHTAAGAFVRRIDFLETTYVRVSTNSVWYISEQTLIYIPAGHRLEIRLNSASTGVGSYGCTISGHLAKLG
jgi:hypothetical protein